MLWVFTCLGYLVFHLTCAAQLKWIQQQGFRVRMNESINIGAQSSGYVLSMTIRVLVWWVTLRMCILVGWVTSLLPFRRMLWFHHRIITQGVINWRLTSCRLSFGRQTVSDSVLCTCRLPLKCLLKEIGSILIDFHFNHWSMSTKLCQKQQLFIYKRTEYLKRTA